MRKISEVISEAFEEYENDVAHEIMKLERQLTFLSKEREYLRNLAFENKVDELINYLTLNGFK